MRTYRQDLTRQVSVGFSIDPAKELEPIISNILLQYFPGKIFIEEKYRAIEKAKKGQSDRTFWYDRSKLNQGGIRATVIWKIENRWLIQKGILGKNKKIFDKEIWGILEAIKVDEQSCLGYVPVISIFCDSQHAMNRLRLIDCKVGQALKTQIYKKVEQLI